MNICFLKENPKIKKRNIKKLSFVNAGSNAEIPLLSALGRRHRCVLSERLTSSDAIYFADASVEALFPELFDFDATSFFYFLLPKLLCDIKSTKGFDRLILCDCDFRHATAFSKEFPELYLMGDEAFNLSEQIFTETGAAAAVIKESTSSDAAVFFGRAKNIPYKLGFHPDFNGSINIGTASLSFYPLDKYAFISQKLGRPLSCKDAARLAASDSSADFKLMY